MGGKNSGRPIGGIGKKVHWEVYYFDPDTKRTLNEKFNNMHEMVIHPQLTFLNRGLIGYYSGRWKKGISNKKGIIIKRIQEN